MVEETLENILQLNWKASRNCASISLISGAISFSSEENQIKFEVVAFFFKLNTLTSFKLNTLTNYICVYVQIDYISRKKHQK